MPLKSFTIFFCFSIILFLANCAVRKAPGGGPKDEIPPQILETFPAANSLNVRKVEYIAFEFSEPVKKNTIKKALRISPPLKLKDKYKWDNDRKVRIFIDDTLREHTTYAFTLGTEAKDWHNNGLERPFVLPFSTDSVIHSCKIKGRVLNQKKGDNITLNVYALQEINHSDTSWFAVTPALTSTTYGNGEFVMNYLKPGKYRLLAYIDQDFSKDFTPYSDTYGIFYQDVHLKSKNDSVGHMYTRMTKTDTASSGISKVEMLNTGELTVTFSRPLEVTSFKVRSVENALLSREISFLWHRSHRKIETAVLYLRHPEVKDSLNIQAFAQDGIREKEFFFNPSENDTIAKPVLTFNPPEILFFEDSLKIDLNNPVDTNRFRKSVRVKFKSNIIPVHVEWNDFKKIKLYPESGWKFDEKYSVEINYAGLADYWDQAFKDTLITYSFTVISEDELGGFAGSFTNDWPDTISVFYLKNLDNNKKFLRMAFQNPQAPRKYAVNYLPGGKYNYWGWFEKDNDYEWDAGGFSPFKFSEPIFWSPDTVRVRVRWTKEGVKIRN